MAAVYNLEVITAYNMYNRFIREVQKSASANVSAMKDADKTRLLAYVSTIRQYLQHVANKPEVDAPENSPHAYELREKPVLLDIENEAAAHICRYLELACFEITNSQTARNNSGIIKFDFLRQVVFLDKIELFMKDYVNITHPLDLPESSPRAPVNGPGRQGLNPGDGVR